MKRCMGWLLFAIFSWMTCTAIAQTSPEYVIGPGDVLKLNVYDHPDMAAEVRVSEAGKIQIPLLGEITVRGLSADAAARELAKQLESAGLIKQPQVTVMVAQFRSQQISVLGYVARPGKYPIERASTLTDLIATAGGTLPLGADAAVYSPADAKNGPRRQEIDLVALLERRENAIDPAVHDGDLIYVPREPRFYIYGEVQHAGVFRVERQMTVMQALSVAGGLTLRGTQDRIKITRRDVKGKLISTRVSLDESVLPDDVLQVYEALF